jgi:flagellar biosynthesis/type III secretory pathway M-ring protein FliF/YscJ
MRTAIGLSPTVALSRLRTPVDRLRRSVMAQRPAVRWGLALGALLAFAAASYWATTSIATFGVRYLASKRQFSSDDLIKICKALDKQRIVYQIDEQRRVEVAADQFDQAAEVVAKLDLGQRPIDEIRGDSSGSIWDPPSEREHKEQLMREKILERLIGQQSGVVWSLVSLQLPRSSVIRRLVSKPSAFVYIETEGGRPLPSRTVQAIPAILAGMVPDLAPAAITVMDKRGNRYFDSGNPALGDSARHHAREEEISEKIVEKLDWIKGVRVQVQVLSSRSAGRAAVAGAGASAAAKQGSGASQVATERAKLGTSQPRSSGSPATVAVNQPLDLEVDRGPHARPAPAAVPAPVAGRESAANSQGAAPPADREREHGRVLVYVPRSFYYNAEISTNNREPSREELLRMADRIEKQIRTAVGLVVPESESWKVEVDRIPDEVMLNRPAVLSSATDGRRKFLDWGIVGATLAMVSIVAAVASWIQLARRPLRPGEPAVHPRRYRADSASEPGPSERVRELIRRSPEAAASVLQRWTGQGGSLS